ncbi:MAG TPA: Calx-beta domain-containing protein, partial [Vicinamibacteria bacterium]
TTNLALNLDAHWTGTGEDLFTSSAPAFQTDYFSEVVRWRLHATSPDKTSPYPFGDLADDSLDEVHRIRTLVPLAHLSDAALRANGQHWLNTITPATSNYSYAEWEFLFYDRNQTATPYEPTWPRHYLAPGPGFFVRRSGWTPGATYWGIWSGPLAQSHQNKDVNGFLIWKGSGWLVTDANLRSHSGIENYTLFHNNFTFFPDPHPASGSGYPPQRGQLWQEPPGDGVRGDGGQALRAESTAEFGYFEGRGTYAYDRSWSGGQFVLDDYVRKIVQVDPDLFVILDRVQTRPGLAGLTKQWRIFSNTAVAVAGKAYSFESGGAKLFGRTLLPTDAAVSTRRLTQAIDGVTDAYEVVAAASGRTRDFFLNVFSLRPAGTTAVPAAAAIAVESGNMEGALADGWAVLLGRSEQVDGTVRYTVDAPAATQHLLIDLLPDHFYAVSVDGTAAAQPRSTAQGALRFAVPAGAHVVEVAPAVVLPSLFVGDVWVMEGSSGAASAAVTVSLSAAGTQNVTLNYAARAGTATAGADFTAVSGALSFPPGTMTRTITVPIEGDTVPEPDETFFVDLTGVAGATLLDGTAQGTIMDDDTARGLRMITPCRLADTRGPAGPTGGPALAANTSRTFPVAGRCGIPATARAVAINLVAVNPGDNGNLRIHPAGTATPLASALSYARGRTRANNGVVGLGAGGQITVRCDMLPGSTATTHFVADVFAYFE